MAMRNRGGERGKDDSWVSYLGNWADPGTLTEIWSIESRASFGGEDYKFC